MNPDLSTYPLLGHVLLKVTEIAPNYGMGAANLVSIRPAYWDSLDTEEQWRAVFVRPAQDALHDLEFFQIWMRDGHCRVEHSFDLDFPQPRIEHGKYSLPWPERPNVGIQEALSIGMKALARDGILKVLHAMAITFEQHGLLTASHGNSCWMLVAECEHEKYVSSWACSINATTGFPIVEASTC